MPRPIKASRYAQLAPAMDADLGADRPGRVASLARSDGYLHAIFPTPGEKRPIQTIDLSFLLQAPHLASAFADGFRRHAMMLMPGTRIALARALRRGFVTFVLQRGESQLRLADLTTALVNDFIGWLNRAEDGKAIWKVKTREHLLYPLRGIIDQLRRDETWAAMLPRALQVRADPWPGGHRQKTPIQVIPRDAFKALYQACVREVSQTIDKVENGRRLIHACRDRIPAHPVTHGDYAELGICLAALQQLFPGFIPDRCDIAAVNPHLANAVRYLHGGSKVITAYFYPSSRLLVPFVLLLGIHFAYNPDTLLGSRQGDYERVTVLGAERLAGRPFKGRSGRAQRRTAPITDEPDNPARLLAFLESWTVSLRPLAPAHLADRVFLFVQRGSAKSVSSFEGPPGWSCGDTTWTQALRSFLADRGLARFTLQQIRPLALDLTHELFDGDLRAVKAVGQQRRPETILSHYTSDAARQRNDERLGQVMAHRERHVQTGGRIDGSRRAAEGDVGAATPGWTCLDPYASPVPGQVPQRLCCAYGQCPACPLGSLDTASAVACARGYELLSRLEEARSEISAQDWLGRWAQVYRRLREHWLPRFAAPLIAAARDLDLPPMPALE